MRYLLLLPLLACATSSEAPPQYERGTYVSPPTFNPAQDAPHTIGQPGHVKVRPEYPKSPHKRMLPQTPETQSQDGLWAGDAKASKHDGPKLVVDRIPSILDLPVSLPSRPVDADQLVARACADSMDTAVRDVLKQVNVRDFGPPRLKACVAAKLYYACLERLKPGNAIYALLASQLEPSPDVSLKRAEKAARIAVGANCFGVYSPGEDVEIIQDTIETWEKLVKIFQQQTRKK